MGHLRPAVLPGNADAAQAQAGEELQLAPGQLALAVASCGIFPGLLRHLVGGAQGLCIALDQRRRKQGRGFIAKCRGWGFDCHG
ncbi:hypothetical protein D3C81_2027490 [compost metagenome]